jgi:hypothetical protein
VTPPRAGQSGRLGVRAVRAVSMEAIVALQASLLVWQLKRLRPMSQSLEGLETTLCQHVIVT